MAQLLRSLSSDLNKDGNMGICVDPRGSSIVAIAGSQPEALPHEHCVMWLVDHVARSQGGGAWESTQTFSSEPTELGVPQSYKDYIQQQQDFQDLRIGAELPRNCQSLQELEQEQSAANNLSKYGPYLCTGYDVYLLREPCLMCAMALVHSRVRRIFFLDCCKNGALISCFKLHTIKELNHHYEVFHIILT
ncbi:CG10927 [Drosophila busckii]|uniref:CG10927 n=2 Tax=Drosophila busckii TaxID=30019 RepID=A0A0M5IXM2_DROBS|nr:CG10927 [Drosophila busckii]